jgi:hypothetical protein
MSSSIILQSAVPPANNQEDHLMRAPTGQPGLSPALISNMVALNTFLATDVGAAWALAGELAGGNVALQGIIFTYAGPGLAAFAVGSAAYFGTTLLDQKFDGALHEAFGGAVEMVLNMEPGQADPYFGGDSFTLNDTETMSEICSNWVEYWEDGPANIIAPPQLGLPMY